MPTSTMSARVDAGELTVIGGGGHVGIPLVLSFANAGFRVNVNDVNRAVLEVLRAQGLKPKHLEGYPRGEWILLDYEDLVVHVFTERSRAFYDLERLWGEATRLEVTG